MNDLIAKLFGVNAGNFLDSITRFLENNNKRAHESNADLETLKLERKIKNLQQEFTKNINACIRKLLEEYNKYILVRKVDDPSKRVENNQLFKDFVNTFINMCEDVLLDESKNVESMIQSIRDTFLNLFKYIEKVIIDKVNSSINELKQKILIKINSSEMKAAINEHILLFTDFKKEKQDLIEEYNINKPEYRELSFTPYELQTLLRKYSRVTLSSFISIIFGFDKTSSICNTNQKQCYASTTFSNRLCEKHGGNSGTCRYINYYGSKCTIQSLHNGFCTNHGGYDLMNSIDLSSEKFGDIVELLNVVSVPKKKGESFVRLNDNDKIYVRKSVRRFCLKLLQKIKLYDVLTFNDLRDVLNKPLNKKFYIELCDIKDLIQPLLVQQKDNNTRLAETLFSDFRPFSIRVDTCSTDDIKILNDLLLYIFNLFKVGRITFENLAAFLTNVSSFTSEKEIESYGYDDYNTFKKYSLSSVKLALALVSSQSLNNDDDKYVNAFSMAIYKSTFSNNTKRDFSTEEDKNKYLSELESTLNEKYLDFFKKTILVERKHCLNNEFVPGDMIEKLRLFIEGGSKYPPTEILDLFVNIKSFYPEITLTKYILGDEIFTTIKDHPSILFLIWITALIRMVPNDPKVSVKHCSFYKTLKTFQTDFYKEMLSNKDKFDKDIQKFIIVFGVCIGNETVRESLQKDNDNRDLIFKRSCSFYSIIAYMQKTASYSYTINNLFGSKGDFSNQNSLWPIATVVYKLIQYLLGFYIKNTHTSIIDIIKDMEADTPSNPISNPISNLRLRLGYEHTIEEYVKIYSNLSPSANLRIFTNIGVWLPQDMLIKLCFDKTGEPIENFFSWNQIINGPLKKTVILNFLQQIASMDYTKLNGYENTSIEQMNIQMLATFGFIFGIHQKTADTLKGKEDNFTSHIVTGKAAQIYGKSAPLNMFTELTGLKKL